MIQGFIDRVKIMMTLAQGFQLAQLAKAKGMAMRTESGRVQFVTVAYDSKGKSTVTEQSGWMTYEEALTAIESIDQEK